MASELAKQTEAVLVHHLQAFGAGDVDEILKDYTEDSVLILPDTTVRGLDGLRQTYTMFLTEILPAGSPFEVKKQEIAGDTAYIFWAANSAKYDVPLGTDTFVVRDGKIVVHTFAGQLVPKNT